MMSPPTANHSLCLTLSDYFPHSDILANCLFRQLDEARATVPDSLVYCQNLDFLRQALKNPNVAAILTSLKLSAEIPPDHPAGVVFSENPRFAFFELYNLLYRHRGLQPIEPFLGRSCTIHPSAVISANTRIGDRVEIGPGAVISEGVEIGNDVFIDANAVIGAEGLVTLHDSLGKLSKVRYAGSVYIGSGSMLLAGTVVAKSLYGSPTSIGQECQIGIMTNIGHGVSIGDHTVVSGNCVIAGRTQVGHSVWMGASCSISQGLLIGDNAQIKMGSVVVSDVASESVVSGNFAISHATHIRQFLSLK